MDYAYNILGNLGLAGLRDREVPYGSTFRLDLDYFCSDPSNGNSGHHHRLPDVTVNGHSFAHMFPRVLWHLLEVFETVPMADEGKGLRIVKICPWLNETGIIDASDPDGLDGRSCGVADKQV